MPPSAMTGTSYSPATRAASLMAVICGTPMPATTRVVQMLPGPDADLDARRRRASISARAPSPVATLPAMICTLSPKSLLSRASVSSTRLRVAVRRIQHQDVDARVDQRPAARSSVSAPRPDRRRHPQPALLVFGRVRVLPGLFDVLDRDQAFEVELVVDEGQLLDAVLVEDALGLLQRRAHRRRHEVFLVITFAIGWS